MIIQNNNLLLFCSANGLKLQWSIISLELKQRRKRRKKKKKREDSLNLDSYSEQNQII